MKSAEQNTMERQNSTERQVKICPKCGRAYHEEPAISRIDNATKICPGCGTIEALECYIEALRKA